jgi:hypothetical protein
VRLPLTPPPLEELTGRPDASARLHRILEAGAFKPTRDGDYLHWDKLRHLEAPDELSTEDWWLGVKLARRAMMRPIPLKDRSGRPFSYAFADLVLELLSGIDRDASGRIEISEQVTSPEVRDRYIVTSLIEEAASSSILAGAATTVQRAKEMIR